MIEIINHACHISVKLVTAINSEYPTTIKDEKVVVFVPLRPTL